MEGYRSQRKNENADRNYQYNRVVLLGYTISIGKEKRDETLDTCIRKFKLPRTVEMKNTGNEINQNDNQTTIKGKGNGIFQSAFGDKQDEFTLEDTRKWVEEYITQNIRTDRQGTEDMLKH